MNSRKTGRQTRWKQTIFLVKGEYRTLKCVSGHLRGLFRPVHAPLHCCQHHLGLGSQIRLQIVIYLLNEHVPNRWDCFNKVHDDSQPNPLLLVSLRSCHCGRPPKSSQPATANELSSNIYIYIVIYIVHYIYIHIIYRVLFYLKHVETISITLTLAVL